MNLSSILGICFGITVMYHALIGTSKDLSFFFDLHGVLIVFGGTIAAASISFSITDVLSLLKIFLLRVLGGHNSNPAKIVNQILDLNKKISLGDIKTDELVSTIKHPFLAESVSLMITGVFSEAELRETIEQRIKTLEEYYLKQANMFRTIGRFPPAFGLLATTLGMIGLLQKIGQPDSQKLIGPAMSVGLIGTLYGITLANLILIPIAENLTERAHEEISLRKLILEGTLLLKTQTNPLSIREKLNSFLLPKKRVKKLVR